MDRPMVNKIDHELVAAAKVIRNHINMLVPAWESGRITMRVNDWETVEFGWWAEAHGKTTRQGFNSLAREYALSLATALSYA